jgi:uncharacterized RDD family membrane protein YckC
VKTVDVITAHNISIDYEAASLASRGVALFLDLLIITVYTAIMSQIIAITTFGASEGVIILLYIIVLIPVTFYSLLFEYLLKGQTVGKMAMGIRVVNLNGENATLNDYTLRWTFRIIDFWFSAGAIGSLFISTTEKGQRLGDVLAQTAVVRNKPEQVYSIRDILNIKDRTKHEPTYLAVSKFTDEDMILIKNAINRVKRYPNDAHKDLVRELAKRAADELKFPKRS